MNFAALPIFAAALARFAGIPGQTRPNVKGTGSLESKYADRCYWFHDAGAAKSEQFTCQTIENAAVKSELKDGPVPHGELSETGPYRQFRWPNPRAGLDFRGRLDPLARHLFHFGDHVALANRRVELDKPQFIDTGVAITLKVVARNRFGIG
jgi:hypothetical protein